VTVIIPTKRSSPFLTEALNALNALEESSLEILVLPDEEEKLPGCRVIATGPVGPAQKRDTGAREARGKILAFLDDDAFIDRNWLVHALSPFEDPEVCAVAGPAITPKTDPFWARVSGAFYVSPLGGGQTIRYWPGLQRKFVDDWPTVNLLVRKDDFFRVGGFDTDHWPGEDTKLCRDFVVKLGKKIVYEPRAIVYHHRRPSLGRHLIQVGRYGYQRGLFTKLFPETSRRLVYFVPSLFVLALVLSVLLVPLSLLPLTSLGAVYGLACLWHLAFVIFREKHLGIGLASVPYTFLSHLSYGWNFLRGSVSKGNQCP
jgi:GT2 family glycosyltransferase